MGVVRLTLLLLPLTSCVFFLPTTDLAGRPCDDAGACADGFVCVADRCVAAEGEGEGEEGEGEEGEGEEGEGEGEEGEGEEGEGEGEGEGGEGEGPFVSVDGLATLTPDGGSVVVVDRGAIELRSVVDGARLRRAVLPALTGARFVRACSGVLGVEAILTTRDALVAADTNSVHDVYRVALEVAPAEGRLVSQRVGGGPPVGRGLGSIDPQVGDDCDRIVFASESLIDTALPGFRDGSRFFYAVEGGSVPVGVFSTDGSLAADINQMGQLARDGSSFTFVLGFESPASNVVLWNTVSETAAALLGSTPDANHGLCPLYDRGLDVLLFQSDLPVASDGDASVSDDVFVAFAVTTAPVVRRLGGGLRIQGGDQTASHQCQRATIVDVDGTPSVVLATDVPLTPDDTDIATDVYVAAIDVEGEALGELLLRSRSWDCQSEFDGVGVDDLLGVGSDGSFAIGNGSGLRVGRLNCP